jgi:hypothetical protein
MPRLDNLLQKIRGILADPEATRWSDDLLTSFIYDGQRDICRRAKLLRSQTTIALMENIALYQLPDDFMLIDKVEVIDQGTLNMVSHTFLDKEYDYWEDDRGNTILAVVYDKYLRGQLRVYPIPEDIFEQNNEVDTYGVATDMDNAIFNSEFGVITDISNYAFPVHMNSPYGIITNDYITKLLRVYYIRKPSDNELEIDDIFDQALQNYAVFMALRNDMDAQNRSAAAEFFAFYERDLKEAIRDDSLDFTRNNNKQYTVPYNGGI